MLHIYAYGWKQYTLKISLSMYTQIYLAGKRHVQQFFFLPMMQVDTAKPLCVEDVKLVFYRSYYTISSLSEYFDTAAADFKLKYKCNDLFLHCRLYPVVLAAFSMPNKI